MKSAMILLYLCLSATRPAYATDQIHDLLIIKGDTIFIKTFPLEELAFIKRPFQYGSIAFPDITCLRGYQATWTVIEKKLFLVKLSKINAPAEQIDLEAYFKDNEYNPVVINGMIFADWYSRNLASFTHRYKDLGCEWKPRKPKILKTAIRFEKGIMVRNSYKRKKA